MSGLIRTRIGRFRLEQAVGGEQLTAETIRRHLQPPNAITAGLRQYVVSPDNRLRLARGQSLPLATAGLSESGGSDQAVACPPAACPSVAADLAMTRGGADRVAINHRVALTDEETGALLGLAELSACGRQLLPKVVLMRPSQIA